MNRLMEILTGLRTSRCECGWETRCGYQWRLHVAAHELEVAA